MAGGRQGGRRRRGAAAGRRRACARRPPPLQTTAQHCSNHSTALIPISPSLRRTALFHHCTAPSPFQWLQGTTLHFPNPRPALLLHQLPAPLPGHSVTPPSHCRAFKPLLPPGLALQDPSKHCTTCQAPHCLIAPVTTLHLLAAETSPNLAVTAATTQYHTSLLSRGCSPTVPLHCLASSHCIAVYCISLQLLHCPTSKHCSEQPLSPALLCPAWPTATTESSPALSCFQSLHHTAPSHAAQSSLAPSHCPGSLPSHCPPISADLHTTAYQIRSCPGTAQHCTTSLGFPVLHSLHHWRTPGCKDHTGLQGPHQLPSHSTAHITQPAPLPHSSCYLTVSPFSLHGCPMVTCSGGTSLHLTHPTALPSLLLAP